MRSPIVHCARLVHKNVNVLYAEVSFLHCKMCFVCELQAQRNNEDVDTIKPLFSVNVDHRVSVM